MWEDDDDYEDIDCYEAAQAAADAICAIRRGDNNNAVTILERAFMPKWASVQDCEAAYREAMGRA